MLSANDATLSKMQAMDLSKEKDVTLDHWAWNGFWDLGIKVVEARWFRVVTFYLDFNLFPCFVFFPAFRLR